MLLLMFAAWIEREGGEGERERERGRERREEKRREEKRREEKRRKEKKENPPFCLSLSLVIFTTHNAAFLLSGKLQQIYNNNNNV